MTTGIIMSGSVRPWKPILCSGTQSSGSEFQRLAAELDHSEETLIDDLIEKSHYKIKQQLATGEEDPTNLVQLAKRCQRIEQSLKTVTRDKALHEKSMARRNAAPTNRNEAVTVTTPNNTTSSFRVLFSALQHCRPRLLLPLPSPLPCQQTFLSFRRISPSPKRRILALLF